MVRPEGAEGGLALLLHPHFGGYRQDRSSPVSEGTVSRQEAAVLYGHKG